MAEMVAVDRPWLAYSVNGDGLGHAARALVLIPLLLPHYKLLICSSEAALVVLQEHFAGRPDVGFQAVPVTPSFVYRQQRISALRTGCRFLCQLLWECPAAASRFQRLLRQWNVVGVITDMEPVLARAAHRAKRPVVCISHQHALVAFRPGALGFSWLEHLVFRVYAALMVPSCSALVLSSFFQPALRRSYRHCLLVGGLLRPELLARSFADQGFAGQPLVYLRRFSAYPAVLEVLNRAGLTPEVFGLPPEAVEPFPSCHFQPRDSQRFVELLAAAPYLIAASGHQLLCEAIELQKPVLAIYEPAHDEQRLNAQMLEQMGYGLSVSIDQFSDRHLDSFLERLPHYRQALQDRVSAAGNSERVVAWLRNQLPA